MNYVHLIFFSMLLISLIYHKILKKKKIKDNIPISQDLINYNKFSNELIYDMNKYNIDSDDQVRVRELIKQIILEKKNEKNVEDYIHTSHSGLLRGCIIGLILGDGGLSSAVTNGATYGILNPIMMGIGY